MISPGCFCPGSGNDPLKKQLVQHLGKEEQASIENKIQERNGFTPLTCQRPAQTPVHAPLHHRRPQLSSPATAAPTGCTCTGGDKTKAVWGCWRCRGEGLAATARVGSASSSVQAQGSHLPDAARAGEVGLEHLVHTRPAGASLGRDRSCHPRDSSLWF